jgi:hypothetical protein
MEPFIASSMQRSGRNHDDTQDRLVVVLILVALDFASPIGTSPCRRLCDALVTDCLPWVNLMFW